MKNRLITLVDLGLDSSFDASMSFVQGITGNINAGWDQPVIDVNFVRTRDRSIPVEDLTHLAIVSLMAMAVTPSWRRVEVRNRLLPAVTTPLATREPA